MWKLKEKTNLKNCEFEKNCVMLGSNSYEFNSTMECRDDENSVGGGGYNNINLLRNGRGEKWTKITKNLFCIIQNHVESFFGSTVALGGILTQNLSQNTI